MRKKIVAGNWKMNKTLPEAIELTTALNEAVKKINLPASTRVVLCAPFIYLQKIKDVLSLLDNKVFEVGAQNCHHEQSGAFTGEISAQMLQSMGIGTVILGHSERRMYFAETNELLRRKIDAALQKDLEVIFCCGESLEQRETGQHFQVVETQLNEALSQLNAEQMARVVIAYEPIWAIGTGRTATPEQAQEMHAYIRTWLNKTFGNEVSEETSILYGGSCNAANADEIFGQPDIDGGLIGGAALKANDFAAIIAARAK